MSFEDIRIIKSPLHLATVEEVRSVAASLNISFPAGYQDYVTTLGYGEYCGQVEVLMPSKILTKYRQYQDTWRDYFFWEVEPEVITKKDVEETIAIANTIDNDTVVFHPRNSAELFILPRNDDYIYKIGSNLSEALDWICETGKFNYKTRSRFFVPQSWYEQNGRNIPWIEKDGWWWIPDDF